jgi:hypothetical protein
VVNIKDPNDELPEVGDIVRHKGHYKSPAANVPKEYFEKDEWEYEPKYAGEVTNRFFHHGSVLIQIRITETENPDFFDIGDTPAIDEQFIREKDHYEVETSENS